MHRLVAFMRELDKTDTQPYKGEVSGDSEHDSQSASC
jgi:hypothetical protein